MPHTRTFRSSEARGAGADPADICTTSRLNNFLPVKIIIRARVIGGRLPEYLSEPVISGREFVIVRNREPGRGKKSARSPPAKGWFWRQASSGRAARRSEEHTSEL